MKPRLAISFSGRERAVRLLRYLFVRRLATDPTKHRPDVTLFEWQKMPDGYRWF